MSDSIFDHVDNRGVFVEMWVIDLLDGDLPAALLFSQLLWWHQPAKDGRPRARFQRDDVRWLSRADDDWWGDCRLTLKQVRRIRGVLMARGLIDYRRFKVAGAPTSAWRPRYEGIEAAIRPDPELPSAGQFRSDPQGADGSALGGAVPIPLETTVKTPVDQPPAASQPDGIQTLLGTVDQQPPVKRTLAGKTETDPLAERAKVIADREWKRRETKPVCGYMAFKARIREALAAGYTDEQVAAVLPSMTVFSRNAFDFALGGAGKKRALPANDRALADDPHYWDEP